jgi:ketosteroid isomerase-like protein
MDEHAGALGLIERIQGAINAHDLDSLIDCFDAAYVNETPVHPARDFEGREQVRRNWSEILLAIPDLHSRLIRSVDAGGVVWAEWEWTGTRRDGAAHLMRGVTILGERRGRAAWVRFYMEPVETGGLAIDAAVQQAVR